MRIIIKLAIAALVMHLPISEDAITVTRLQRRIDVDGVYTREILLAPGYTRPWTFTVDVVVLTLN